MQPKRATVVVGGRSPVGSARRRGRSLVAVRRSQTDQRPCHRAADQRVWWRAARDSNPQPPDPTLIPARPSGPFASPLVLVNGPVTGPSRAAVPARHAWLGRNVVAVSGRCRQTGRLVTRRFLPRSGTREHQMKIWCSAQTGSATRFTRLRFGSIWLVPTNLEIMLSALGLMLGEEWWSRRA
jgi:hypothetical protein